MKKLKFALICVLAMCLVAAGASAFEIVGDKLNLVTHPDGSAEVFPAGSMAPAALEAGGDFDGKEYVVVQHEDGTSELILADIAYALEAFYTSGNNQWEQFASSSECSFKCTDSYSKSRCSLVKGNSYTLKSGTRKCSSTGKCSWTCYESGTACTSSSQCSKTLNCGNGCTVGTNSCSNGVCIYGAKCGTAVECGTGCTSDSQAKTRCLAQSIARTKALVNYYCSAGEPICKWETIGKVECTKATDPKCKSLAASECPYGYTGGTCRIDTDCSGNIFNSYCEYACKSAPTQAPVCGNIKCETPSETCANCVQDCGSCGTNGKCPTGSSPSLLNKCAAGIFSDLADTSTFYKWSCLGSNGGTTATCGLTKSAGADTPTPQAINGQCTSTKLTQECATGNIVSCLNLVVQSEVLNKCAAGTFSDMADTSAFYRWSCVGSNGGTTASCGVKKPTEATTCGDGKCEGVETQLNCPADCASDYPVCGNLLCESGENSGNCPVDCGGGDDDGSGNGQTCTPGLVGSPYCSGKDLVQDYKLANCDTTTAIAISCEVSCVNGACSLSTTEDICGDEKCGSTENVLSCPEDCNQVYCGNGFCDDTESSLSCKIDCPGEGTADGGGGIGIAPPEDMGVIIVAIIVIIALVIGLYLIYKPRGGQGAKIYNSSRAY